MSAWLMIPTWPVRVQGNAGLPRQNALDCLVNDTSPAPVLRLL